MRIPITMCHGIRPPRNAQEKPLTSEHFDKLMRIVSELGFESINYDQLAAWRAGTAAFPKRPIMLDFDHPVRTMRYEVKDVLDRYGFKANLFVHTAPMLGEQPCPDPGGWMTWQELRDLVQAGWHIGAHTHTHPNLSKLSLADPDGAMLRAELDRNEELLKKHLGVTPRDFAFTGTSFSSLAAREVEKRYRFGRLWIVGSIYQMDGKDIRYAEMVGVPGPDLADGGPPVAARYITKDTPAHRLPAMELQALIHEPGTFRAYLEGATSG